MKALFTYKNDEIQHRYCDVFYSTGIDLVAPSLTISVIFYAHEQVLPRFREFLSNAMQPHHSNVVFRLSLVIIVTMIMEVFPKVLFDVCALYRLILFLTPGYFLFKVKDDRNSFNMIFDAHSNVFFGFVLRRS